MLDFDAFSLLDIKKRNKRSHGKRKNGNFKRKHKTVLSLFDFVCVEVLRPSQSNGVMSSAINLPNHTFTGQA